MERIAVPGLSREGQSCVVLSCRALEHNKPDSLTFRGGGSGQRGEWTLSVSWPRRDSEGKYDVGPRARARARALLWVAMRQKARRNAGNKAVR